MRFLLLALALILSCASPPKEDRRNWKVYYDLGQAAYLAKNYSEAIANFHKAIRLNPDRPEVWNALGLAYMQVGEYEKARESFLRALSVDPHFTEAKMNLGVLYAKLGNYELALKFLKESAQDELFEKKHVAYLHLANVYKQLGDLENYVKSLQKAVAYNPNFVDAQLQLAQAYEELGRYEKAKEVYESLIAQGYKTNFVLYKLAEVNYKLGRYEEAKRIIRQLLQSERLTEEQRKQVKQLLSKILIEQQRKLVLLSPPKEERKEERKERKKVRERYFAVQVGAFSSKKRAESLAERLRKMGFEDVVVLQADGMYKVLYGKFKSRQEALRKRNELFLRTGYYGFVVEMR
ncbi:MAG: tetratricopeptide repeat protein [Aquificae bacterium]|nr:tetratricopeptide repeat protein [Aquificota bacterium]